MDKDLLSAQYESGLSMQEIAHVHNCSVHRVQYWMTKHNIARRSIGEAMYAKRHPQGDPFTVRPVRTLADAKLQGMGIGLYWGEGTKANKHSIRLGNSEPELIKTFMNFLVQLYGVKKEDFRFGMQLFTDIEPEEALHYWANELGVKRSQFYKITVTISGSLGTYRKKSRYGVVTLYYNNKKLRDLVMALLPR